MNRPFWIVIFLFSIVCISCKKEHLYDEREVFIGSWEWDHTIVNHRCTTDPLDTIFSSDVNNSYALEISKSEKVFFVENGEVVSKSPIFVSFFESSDVLQNGYSFVIYFDEESQDRYNGYISSDTLSLSGYWPSAYQEEICTGYSNIFISSD